MTKNNTGTSLITRIFRRLFAVPVKQDFSLPRLHSILVIRQHDQLGDLLASTPFFRALKEKYPRSEVTVIVSKKNAQGLQYSRYIDTVAVFHKRNWYLPGNISHLWKILKKEYDAVFVPCTVSVSFTSNFMARLANAKRRIGAESLNGEPNQSAYFFDTVIPLDWRNSPDYYIGERALDFLRPFGIDTHDFSSQLTFKKKDRKRAKEFSGSLPNKGSKFLIGMHPGAGKLPNRWHYENFIELIKRLSQTFSCNFYLTGSAAENEILQAIADSHPGTGIFLDPLPEVAALVDISHLFITNDTGIMHVAGTTKTPQISLFGPTNPFQWAPCGPEKKFLHNSDVINEISVDEVFELAKQLLSRSKRSV